MDLKKIKLKGGNKKNMKTKIKQEKGITLIALVVTIVVLLILAGVSINAIFNENGLIKKAQEAQSKMDEAKQNDLDTLDNLEKFINNVTNNNVEEDIKAEEVSEDNANAAIISGDVTKYYDNEVGAAKILKDGETLKLLGKSETNKNLTITAKDITIIIDRAISGTGKIINNGDVRIKGQSSNAAIKIEIENNGNLSMDSISIENNIISNSGTFSLSNATASSNSVVIKSGQADISTCTLNNVTVGVAIVTLSGCEINGKVVNNGGTIEINSSTADNIENNSGTIIKDGEPI